MGKFNYLDLSPKERAEFTNELVAILRGAKNDKAMRQLISSLLTPSEIVMLGRRIVVAERLIQEKTYDEIRQELKVGLSTIISVHTWLKRGGHEGIKGRSKKKIRLARKRSSGVITGSPEHGLNIIAARMGLLGFLFTEAANLLPFPEDKGKKKR